jgi:hypothetical protein
MAICEHMEKKEKLGNQIIAMMQQVMAEVEILN